MKSHLLIVAVLASLMFYGTIDCVMMCKCKRDGGLASNRQYEDKISRLCCKKNGFIRALGVQRNGVDFCDAGPDFSLDFYNQMVECCKAQSINWLKYTGECV